MLRKFFWIGLAVMLFSLYGCAGKIIPLSSARDPDGDGDCKGATLFPMTWPSNGRKTFVYDPPGHAWAVYDESGERQNTGKASGGVFVCPGTDESCMTAVGEFRILRKGDSSCISSIYPLETNGGAPMPYCMFFHNGQAIHGTPYVADYYNSHGCIGVTVLAAEWLSNYLPVGSRVVVLPY